MTPTIGAICQQHLQYMKWADNLLLTAVRANLPSNKETLDHIFMAERIWLDRVQGTFDPKPPEPHVDIAALADEWPGLHEQWLEWAASQTDWAKVVSYRTLSGVESASPLWQIVLHVANHGSYHRGQVAAALRASGYQSAEYGFDRVVPNERGVRAALRYRSITVAAQSQHSVAEPRL